MSIDRKLLGRAIRQVRELRGLSQAALAQKAGLRGNSVALIERGERGVSIDTLNSLAEALEIPSACLTMLGMSRIRGLSDSSRLVRSFQKLITATLEAEMTLEAQESQGKQRVARRGNKKSQATGREKNLAKANSRVTEAGING
jgi:transcriptional regulator with XRE-family HTH domain